MEYDWDLFVIDEKRKTTSDPISFEAQVAEWDCESVIFKHGSESDCPSI